jgi:glutamate dehydrogenase
MHGKSSTLKSDLIESLRAMAQDRLPAGKAADAALFLGQFFARVAPHDLLAQDPEDLFGAALTIWAFGRERAPDQPKIRAYNPRFEASGWQSPHTVIEIINDDMPLDAAQREASPGSGGRVGSLHGWRGNIAPIPGGGDERI